MSIGGADSLLRADDTLAINDIIAGFSFSGFFVSQSWARNMKCQDMFAQETPTLRLEPVPVTVAVTAALYSS